MPFQFFPFFLEDLSGSGKTGKTGSDTGNRYNERQLLYQGKGTARFRL